MVGAFVPGLRGPGSSPGWGNCFVFLAKTLLAQCLSSPRCINGCWGNSNGVASNRGGSRNIPSRFMPQKPGLARMQTFMAIIMARGNRTKSSENQE